uniref:Uncharacterized protein n=1 Tax=Grammatophora oceanica TaxID=210454 RepID=A0A7S1Y562_9STRA
MTNDKGNKKGDEALDGVLLEELMDGYSDMIKGGLFKGLVKDEKEAAKLMRRAMKNDFEKKTGLFNWTALEEERLRRQGLQDNNKENTDSVGRNANGSASREKKTFIHQPGNLVVIRNIQSRPELNGQQGTIKTILKSGRVAVSISNETVSMKPENLRALC